MAGKVYEKSQQAVSRILSAFARLRRAGVTTIPLAPPLLAGSSDRPGGIGRAVRPARPRASGAGLDASLFGLAPCGVLPATGVAAGAVRSYRTFSPLPAFAHRPTTAHAKLAGRYIFCATVLQVALTGRYPAHCPAEFGLSSRLRLQRLARRLVWLAATVDCTSGWQSGCWIRRVSGRWPCAEPIARRSA